MVQKVLWMLMSLCFFAGVAAPPLKAAEAAKAKQTTAAKTSSGNAKISLAEVAPELYYMLRRYPKFYGDPNTKHGGLSGRSQLLCSVGGTRDFLVDRGIYFDVSVTQFLQGNVSGGKDNGDTRYNGTVDYWLTFDTGKARLWSGGAVFLHAESSWQANRSINSDVGSLLPANFDAAMPTPSNSDGIALPEFYLVQALPANWLVIAGKVNWAGLGDTNVFANNERTQFDYTGLVNNPILGAFVPYTPIGLAGVWTASSKKHQVAILGLQSTGNATTSGFDNFNGDYTIGMQYIFSPTFCGNRPGNYLILSGYDTKDVRDFAVDQRLLIGQLIGRVPAVSKSGNYTVLLNFDQYLWVKGGSPIARRKGLPPVGIGIFGRAGWAPQDRNIIDQFYSFGIGGYGMLIPGRDYDQWGLGWGGTHISSDLRDILSSLRRDVQAWEHGFEAFYNFQLIPAAHLTLNAQLINTPVGSRDIACTLGARLQIDF